jgi:hypothetical protein
MQEPEQHPLEAYGEHGQFVYHYTTRNAAFEHILPSGQLRMNSLRRLRDPVENKDWVQGLFTSVSWRPEDVDRFRAATDRVLDDTEIVSFTLDAPVVGGSPEYSRGWARPRMWEQYAENHAGICLMFDRKRLDDWLQVGLPERKLTVADEVVYSNSPLPGHEEARTLHAVSLIAAGDEDLELGLKIHIERHAKELFFRKLADWSTEREYRYVVFDKHRAETLILYGNALHAVIVGERFPKWQISGAAEVCSKAGAKLLQIQWGASPPKLVDLTASKP